MFVPTDSLLDTVSRLSRELNDDMAPQMGVHTLSEFVYCRRAGVISEDSRSDDPGSELPRSPALGGLPTHDLDRIEEAMEQIAGQLKYPVGFAVVLLLSAVVVYWNFTLLPAVAFVPVLVITGRWLFRLLKDYWSLRKSLRLAERSAIKEPDWDLRQPQPIFWWSLIRAGFVSEERLQPLVDPDLRLKGKPWRVLHRGRTVYPVLRIRVEDERHDRSREGRLRKQQLARIAAYAYLFSRCERADSSWAIVLFGRSNEGVAVPIDEKAWMAFYNGLLLARDQLTTYHKDSRFRPDANIPACLRCPLGRPKLLTQKTVLRRGVEIAPFGTEVPQKGDVYHCQCGDHFHQIPPHEKALKLGLIR